MRYDMTLFTLLSLLFACKEEPDSKPKPADEQEEYGDFPELPVIEPLPFEECPDVPLLGSIDSGDISVSGTSATLQGEYLRCATWDAESEAEACYTDTNAVVAAIEEVLYDLLLDELGLFGVSCDSSIVLTCGPLYPEAVYEAVGDDTFRCCFVADIGVTCGL